MHLNPSHVAGPGSPFGLRGHGVANPAQKQFSDSESDLSELSEDPLSDGSEYIGSGDEMAMSPAERAENEDFGKNYDGPKLTPEQASRLLILMDHASSCPGRHKSAKHLDVCNSVKFLMLHVRDCPGTTSTDDICPFPWCRKVKHLLYHLVSCQRPKDCAICSPITLSSNLFNLVGLNQHRRKKQKERTRAAMAAAAAKARAAPPKVGQYKPKAVAYRTAPLVHKKGPATVGAYKPVAQTKPALQASHVRPKATGTTIRPPVGASTTKPTNGVIVKTLVKPSNKTHVTIKSAGNNATKINSNGLVGPPRKATFVTTVLKPGTAATTATAGVPKVGPAGSVGTQKTVPATKPTVVANTAVSTTAAPTVARATTAGPGKAGVPSQGLQQPTLSGKATGVVKEEHHDAVLQQVSAPSPSSLATAAATTATATTAIPTTASPINQSGVKIENEAVVVASPGALAAAAAAAAAGALSTPTQPVVGDQNDGLTTTAAEGATGLTVPPVPSLSNLPDIKTEDHAADTLALPSVESMMDTTLAGTQGSSIGSPTLQGIIGTGVSSLSIARTSSEASITATLPPLLGAVPPKASVGDLLAPPSPSELSPAIMTPPGSHDSPTEPSTAATLIANP